MVVVTVVLVQKLVNSQASLDFKHVEYVQSAQFLCWGWFGYGLVTLTDPWEDPAAGTVPAITKPPPTNRCLSFSGADSSSPGGVLGAGGVMAPRDMVKALSSQTIKKRVDRLMTPKADGTFKVPKELVDEWKRGNQASLVDEFQRAGLDKDRVFTAPPQTVY